MQVHTCISTTAEHICTHTSNKSIYTDRIKGKQNHD